MPAALAWISASASGANAWRCVVLAPHTQVICLADLEQQIFDFLPGLVLNGCCGGWRTGKPLTRLAKEGRRLFAEAIHSDERALDFHRRLIAALWDSRDASLGLHGWLAGLRTNVIEPFALECAALRDEIETLAAFVARIAPAGDRVDIVLGELADDGEHLDRVTQSTLHSAKGRELHCLMLQSVDTAEDLACIAIQWRTEGRHYSNSGVAAVHFQEVPSCLRWSLR